MSEGTGTWPAQPAKGPIFLIPTGEGTTPQRLRPIGLMGVCIKAVGIDKDARLEDEWIDQALAVEASPVEATRLVGMSIDVSTECLRR